MQSNSLSLQTGKFLALDIETENTGVDIMKDNRRVISVQIGDDTSQELYYSDSKDSQHNLDRFKPRILSLISEGYVLVGYNIKGFDIPLLKKFLEVEIPESNTLELTLTEGVIRLGNKLGKRPSLEEACNEFGVEADHKRRMNAKAEQYKVKPDIRTQARIEAAHLAESKGWSQSFAFERVIGKIAGGYAILDAYKEFVQRGGSRDTLFYEYAIGDIVCEFRLFQILKQP